MKQGDPQRFPKTTPVVIKGRINGTYSDRLRLKDCEVASKGEFAGEKGKADPYNLDLNKPIPASDLYAAFNAWEGKEVAVIGNYWGTTTSTLPSGKVIRVDLTDPQGNKAVGCNMKADPGKVEPREGRVFKGTVKGRHFDQIQLENGELMK